jgi:hypothetical protein
MSLRVGGYFRFEVCGGGRMIFAGPRFGVGVGVERFAPALAGFGCLKRLLQS